MDNERQNRAPESGADDNWRPDPAEVARLAYSYYEQRACEHGAHEDDWHRAERELRERYAAGRTSPAAAASDTAPRTVVGVFPTIRDARRAFDDLHAEGFSRDELSLIGNRSGSDDPDSPPVEGAAESAIVTDAGIGAAVGGTGGLLLGLAALAIPGVGPVLAAGPILAALGGAGLGAAAGGLIGALTERGIPEESAGHYAESIRRGGFLVTVQGSGDRASRAAEILDRNGPIDIDDNIAEWRQRGWTSHDTSAAPLDASEVRRERDYFRAADSQAREWSRESSAEESSIRRASKIYDPAGRT